MLHVPLIRWASATALANGEMPLVGTQGGSVGGCEAHPVRLDSARIGNYYVGKGNETGGCRRLDADFGVRPSAP